MFVRFLNSIISVGCTTFTYLLLLVLLTACPRAIVLAPNPPNPKQGDIVKVRVAATDKENLAQLTYSINGVAGSGIQVPYDVEFNTCKDTGVYHSNLDLEGVATYNDGEVKRFSQQYNLLIGENKREDKDLEYSIFLGGGGRKARSVQRNMIDNFRGSFDAYSQSLYDSSYESYYTTNSKLYINNVDMAVSFGHGGHHSYAPRIGETVNLSDTEFGIFAPCDNTGDLEYLVFFSCYTLSMEDAGSKPYSYYWFHQDSSKLETRPFTGLHMAIGFRTDFVVDIYLGGSWRTKQGRELVKKFANNLDGGWEIITAWLDAVSDELIQANGDNMATVFYLREYQHDTIYTEKDDYIFPHAKYVNAVTTIR